jgi:hypothetical protein
METFDFNKILEMVKNNPPPMYLPIRPLKNYGLMWDRYTNDGYHLLILKIPVMLHLCGYVGVPKTHPFYGLNDISDPRLTDINIHGGITYTGNHHRKMKKSKWYIGFDCAHAFDIIPGFKIYSPLKFVDCTYKTIDYVKNETEYLYKQLKTL